MQVDWNIPPSGFALSLVLSKPMVAKRKPILIRKRYALQVPSTAGLETFWEMHKGTKPSIFVFTRQAVGAAESNM